MGKLYARTVFFVEDAERALRFYTETLGFALDWNYQEKGRAFVVQVSLLGFELILNQAEGWTGDRPGRGRVFIGLDDNQLEPFQRHIESNRIEARAFHWGNPTLVICDPDGNEIFVWLPGSEYTAMLDGLEPYVPQ
ncbi:MAG: VOC family protein [Gammaproteobacteria bacterium]